MPVILNHNIPDFYFASFAKPIENLNFERPELDSVWINSKIPKPTWKRIALADFLDHLTNPDPTSTNVELVAERLAGISTNYSSVLNKISGRASLDRDELLSLSFLVLTLLANAESPRIRGTQKQFDANEFTWDKFESAVLGADVQSKRTRSSLDIADGDLLDHGMHFILNRTTNPFITSDRAIFVDSWTPQEAQRVFEPLCILDSEVGGAMERVTILPISPRAVIVSSAFIQRRYPNVPYVECWSNESVLSLNLLACYSADRIIISNQDKPFGQSEENVRNLMSASSRS
jgi:Protein of unknown function (DUF4238)